MRIASSLGSAPFGFMLLQQAEVLCGLSVLLQVNARSIGIPRTEISSGLNCTSAVAYAIKHLLDCINSLSESRSAMLTETMALACHTQKAST